jgi:hypothetical protein
MRSIDGPDSAAQQPSQVASHSAILSIDALEILLPEQKLDVEVQARQANFAVRVSFAHLVVLDAIERVGKVAELFPRDSCWDEA